jgi:hypothetical protein
VRQWSRSLSVVLAARLTCPVNRYGRSWTATRTVAQHREVLALSGWLALLVGCVEYDMGDRHAAESTRRAALSLATKAVHSEVAG